MYGEHNMFLQKNCRRRQTFQAAACKPHLKLEGMLTNMIIRWGSPPARTRATLILFYWIPKGIPIRQNDTHTLIRSNKIISILAPPPTELKGLGRSWRFYARPHQDRLPVAACRASASSSKVSSGLGTQAMINLYPAVSAAAMAGT